MSAPTLLVVGAAPHSLGSHIVDQATSGYYDFARVCTAGIEGEEFKMNVTHSDTIRETLNDVKPDIVVCTVGVNEPSPFDDPYLPLKMTEAFRVNVVGPLEVLDFFTTSKVVESREGLTKKFVAISSNSAHIARRGSIAYCTSKAALSMALRVAARELGGKGVQVWGYEPGLLAGTPMTKETDEMFGRDGTMPLHRMPGVPRGGIDPVGLARRIVTDVADFNYGYNGTMFRFDAGEQ